MESISTVHGADADVDSGTTGTEAIVAESGAMYVASRPVPVKVRSPMVWAFMSMRPSASTASLILVPRESIDGSRCSLYVKLRKDSRPRSIVMSVGSEAGEGVVVVSGRMVMSTHPSLMLPFSMFIAIEARPTDAGRNSSSRARMVISISESAFPIL